MFVFRLDVCSNTVLQDVVGQTLDASIEADRAKLDEARLQATLTGTDFITNEEVQIEVDVDWIGVGERTFQSQQNRFRQAGFLARSSFKGVFRDETRREVSALVARLRDERGIDGIILGGTELPLLLRAPAVEDVPVLDTTAVHVTAIVRRLWEPAHI